MEIVYKTMYSHQAFNPREPGGIEPLCITTLISRRLALGNLTYRQAQGTGSAKAPEITRCRLRRDVGFPNA